MKKRITFITFLMLLCSVSFGENYYTPVPVDPTVYNMSMTVATTVSFEGAVENRDNLELGVLCNGVCRATTMTKDYGTGQCIALTTFRGKSGEEYTLKVYDHNNSTEHSNYVLSDADGNEFVDNTISFNADFFGNPVAPYNVNFIAPDHFIPEIGDYENNMTLTAVVLIDGVEQKNAKLELGAFIGDKVVGSSKTDFTYTINEERFYANQMGIAGNDNDVVTFKLYDHENGEELEFLEVNSITFETNKFLGTIAEPIKIDFLTKSYVAQIGETKYETLAAAVEAATAGQTIVLLQNINLTESLTVEADQTIVLDLNGKKITYNSTTQGEAMITNRGNLTINDGDSKDEMGEIYYNYIGEPDPSFGKGNYTILNGGTLTVNGGKIHIAKLSQHAKYPIDNNSTSGDAILVINGGHLYNYNTSAIRQFCNSTTNKNSVTINGGLIEGYSAIWMQNPGSKEVNGQLSITGGEIKTTAKAYVEGTSPISEVASKIYCTTEGGTWDEESAFVITGGTINENVYLGEESPASMTLYKEAQFNGYVEFDLSEGRELVHNGLSNVTVTKNITGDPVPQDNNEYVGGWYTISSPVGTVDHVKVDGLLNGTHDLYRYNEANAMWENVKNTEHSDDFTTLEAGRGYIYANTADTELSFTGTLNTAAVTQNLTASHAELTGFNLIGNPFTYNITKSNMSGASLAEGFYTLSNHGAWQTNVESATIAPMQGALIKATETTANFTIAPNSAKRSESENNGQIKIEVSNDNYNDVAYVSFNEGIGLDKINHRNAEIPMVYIPVDGVNYAIAMMNQEVTEIPVSFEAKSMGQYTIGAEAQDCEYAMMTLVDRFTGVETNLLIEDYTFMATSNDNAERFIIKLAMSNSHDGDNENFAFINNGMMYIYNIEGQGVVSVYDVTGRPVAEYNVAESANISTSDFAAGVYIIRMSDENGVKTQKIVVE